MRRSYTTKFVMVFNSGKSLIQILWFAQALFKVSQLYLKNLIIRKIKKSSRKPKPHKINSVAVKII